MPTVVSLKRVSEEEFRSYVEKLERVVGLREDSPSETKSLWILPGSIPKTLARKEIYANRNAPSSEYTKFEIADIPVENIKHA